MKTIFLEIGHNENHPQWGRYRQWSIEKAGRQHRDRNIGPAVSWDYNDSFWVEWDGEYSMRIKMKKYRG